MQVLSAIKNPPSITTSVLESSAGLCLGDICFAEIYTTLRMHAVSFTLFERLIANGSFNPEHMAESDYSHSTAILLVFIPDAQLKDIERVGIGLVICQCNRLLTPISSVDQFITYIHNALKLEGVSHMLTVRMYAMLLSNYGGHMAYATDLPFCVAYPLEFVKKDDPGAMTFQDLDNHPVTFMANAMVICQLLTKDCPEHEYARMICGRYLIIPRCMQFGHSSFQR